MPDVQPKVCAVCGRVCDRSGDQWIHSREITALMRGEEPDHVCVPVDYDLVNVQNVCDFCERPVEMTELCIVPANDFRVPLINHMSQGGWACDPTCAEIASRRDWQAMIVRHFESPATETIPIPPTIHWLYETYLLLEANMTGEPRPFRVGDERIKQS